MTGITLHGRSITTDQLRPVRLQTDLAQLADLIETAFSNSMDAGGRAAIREMRQLSRLGTGLGVLTHLNELAHGMSLGYVWEVEGRIVGNVSVYPADYPRELGRTWIIANVAVYPAYRGRGIAKQLMHACMDMIAQQPDSKAILQVDYENDIARRMYRKLGFVEERAWTQWRRAPYRSLQPLDPLADSPHLRIVQRRLGDVQAEYELAKMVRPQDLGGLDWLRPTHMRTFRLSPLRRLNNWLNLRDVQRLVIRSASDDALLAWLQIESSLGMTNKQLLLMAHPTDDGTAARALVASAVRRFGADGLTLFHPSNDDRASHILRSYQFMPRRQVVHMRHDFAG